MGELKIGSFAITDNHRQETKAFRGSNFTVQVPLPGERATILAMISRFMGSDINTYTQTDYEYIRMLITLNNVVVESPDWWTNALDCIDEELLYDLWDFYLEKEKSFKQFLKKNVGGGISK